MKRTPQLALDLLPEYGWGGARKGAGRKPKGEQSSISHRRKLEIDEHCAVHVTLRVREHVWNLRSRRSHRVIASALRGVLGRKGFRVVHFSIQGNHLHLIVEAVDAATLANAIRSVSGRIAHGLNAMMELRGVVFSDRYHAHVLRTPSEIRHALAYVLGNFASHAARRGERLGADHVDPYSSSAETGPDGQPPPVSRPETWLLCTRGGHRGEQVTASALAREKPPAS